MTKNIGLERMYKILTHDAKSAHGGDFDWSPYLPKYKWDKKFETGKWIPGAWLPEIKNHVWCERGYHLTSHPLRWKVKNGRIFIAEYSGEIIQENTTDKACFSAVRLIAELGIDSLDLDVKIFKMINSHANLSSADLRYADLSSADLSYANLRYADLSYANLSYANLRYADLRYANLRYADLSHADLSSADLSYANLSYASSLEGCYIEKNPNISGYKFENDRLWRI